VIQRGNKRRTVEEAAALRGKECKPSGDSIREGGKKKGLTLQERKKRCYTSVCPVGGGKKCFCKNVFPS